MHGKLGGRDLQSVLWLELQGHGAWFRSLCKCIVRGSTETDLVARAGRLLLPQLVLVLFKEHSTVTVELGGKM